MAANLKITDTGGVAYTENADANAVLVWRDGEPVAVLESALRPPTEALHLEASVDGGMTWRSLGGDITVIGQTTVTDWEGLVHGETLYRGTASVDSGASAETVIAVDAASNARWVGSGPTFADPARLPYTPNTGLSVGRERSTEKYDGRARPVAYSGEHLSRVVSAGGTLFDDSTDSASRVQLESLAQMEGPIFLHRDPDGNHLYGVISELKIDRQNHKVWGWGLSVTETGRDED